MSIQSVLRRTNPRSCLPCFINIHGILTVLLHSVLSIRIKHYNTLTINCSDENIISQNEISICETLPSCGKYASFLLGKHVS
jgi:hypothetical protein